MSVYQGPPRKGTKRFSKPTQGMVVCSGCDGDGACFMCEGKRRRGRSPCSQCFGDGLCDVCEGAGQIAALSSAAQNDDSAAEILQLGYEWPRYQQIAECCVVSAGKVDLQATLLALKKQEIMWDEQYAEARANIRSGGFPGARSADELTDAHIYAAECRQATEYIEMIIKVSLER